MPQVATKDAFVPSALSCVIIFWVFIILYIDPFHQVAFIEEILPPDPKHPRRLRVKVGPKGHSKVDYCEFDTEESAQDWRRELAGMLG